MFGEYELKSMSGYLDGDDNEEGLEPGPGGDDLQRQRWDTYGYPDREYRDRSERSQRFNLLDNNNGHDKNNWYSKNQEIEINKAVDLVDRRRAEEIRRDKNGAGAEIT